MKLTLSSAVCCLIVFAAIAPSALLADDAAGHVTLSPPSGPTGYGPSVYQPYVPSNPQAANIVLRDTVGHAVDAPFGPLIRLDGNWGDGLGFTGDMYRVGTFLPWHLDPGASLFFAAIDGGVSEDGTGVLNLTGGYRKYHEDRNRVESYYMGFDWDDTKTTTFKRVMVGYQSLGKYVDWNFNAYNIVDNQSNVINPRIESKIFSRNAILFIVDKVVESAYNVVDLETGGPVPVLGRYGVSAYAGGYYVYQDDDDQAIGWKIRVHAQLNENLAAGVRFTSDDVFGAQAWANVEMTFPAGKPMRWFRPLSVQQRLASAIPRDTRIPTNIHTVTTYKEVEVNPATGRPYFVLHIDPDARVNGIGTVESPFNSVANLMNRSDADIIFVNDGNRDNLVGVIPLFDNQRLLSSAFRHTFESVAHGICPLPGFNPNDNRPILSNPGGDTVVTFSDNNEVNGFEIDGTNMTNGLFAENIRDVTLRNNFISNAVNGVNFQDIRGTALITDNFFVNNSGTGFLLNNDDGETLLLRFNRNVASMNGTGASISASNGSTIFVSANNNSFDDNTSPNTGLNLTATGPDSLIAVSNMMNNTFNRNNGNSLAINALGDGGNVRVNDFENNQVNGALLNGIQITVDGPGSRAKLDAAGSEFVGNLGAGIAAQMNDGKLNLIVGGETAAEGNLIDNNLDAGISLNLLRFSKTQFVAQNNVIINTRNDPATNNLNQPNGDAIFINRQQASLLTGPMDPDLGVNTALIANNTLTNNRGNGISIFLDGSDPSDPDQLNTFQPNAINLVDNVVTDNRRNGMLTTAQGNAVLLLNGSNNAFNTNRENGMAFAMSNTAALGNPLTNTPSLLDGTQAVGNGDDGISFTTEFQSQTLLTLRSNTADTLIASNGRHGISLQAPPNGPDDINTSTTDIRIFGDMDGGLQSGNFVTLIANNGVAGTGNGIDLTTTDFAAPTLEIQATSIIGNNGDGLAVNSVGLRSNPLVTLGGFNSVDITQFPFTPAMLGALDDGISVNRGVIIDGNADDGIDLFAAGSSVIRLDVTESVIGSIGVGNGGHGINFRSQGTTDPYMFASTQLMTEISGSVIAGNGGHGANILLGGSAGDRQNGFENRITFDASNNPLVGVVGNLISTNARDGIRFFSDPGDVNVELVDDGTGMGILALNRYRQVFIPNAPMQDNPNPTGSPPILVNPEDDLMNVDDFRFPFLNTTTVSDTVLTVEDSTIEFNGTNLVDGDAIFVDVGTNSYLGLDLRRNTFRGNNRSDLRTQSHISESMPPPSYIDRASPLPDTLFLDNTAQIDLILVDNVGNTLDVARTGLDATGNPNGQQARYTNADPGKNPSAGMFGFSDLIDRRLATVFRVREANNTFISQGAMLDLQQVFTVPTIGHAAYQGTTYNNTRIWDYFTFQLGDVVPDQLFP